MTHIVKFDYFKQFDDEIVKELFREFVEIPIIKSGVSPKNLQTFFDRSYKDQELIINRDNYHIILDIFTKYDYIDNTKFIDRFIKTMLYKSITVDGERKEIKESCYLNSLINECSCISRFHKKCSNLEEAFQREYPYCMLKYRVNEKNYDWTEDEISNFDAVSLIKYIDKNTKPEFLEQLNDWGISFDSFQVKKLLIDRIYLNGCVDLFNYYYKKDGISTIKNISFHPGKITVKAGTLIINDIFPLKYNSRMYLDDTEENIKEALLKIQNIERIPDSFFKYPSFIDCVQEDKRDRIVFAVLTNTGKYIGNVKSIEKYVDNSDRMQLFVKRLEFETFKSFVDDSSEEFLGKIFDFVTTYFYLFKGSGSRMYDFILMNELENEMRVKLMIIADNLRKRGYFTDDRFKKHENFFTPLDLLMCSRKRFENNIELMKKYVDVIKNYDYYEYGLTLSRDKLSVDLAKKYLKMAISHLYINPDLKNKIYKKTKVIYFEKEFDTIDGGKGDILHACIECNLKNIHEEKIDLSHRDIKYFLRGKNISSNILIFLKQGYFKKRFRAIHELVVWILEKSRNGEIVLTIDNETLIYDSPAHVIEYLRSIKEEKLFYERDKEWDGYYYFDS